MKLFLGRDIETGERVFLDANGARAILICGKRGSGKSYTLGVLAEELLENGREEVVPIIIDPMGIYHTMVLPNEAQQEELYQWGFISKGWPVRLLIPGEPKRLYDPDILAELERRGLELIPLRLNPSDLTPDGWCDLFNADINKPMGIVLFRAAQRLEDKVGRYNLNDLVKAIERDERATTTTKEALINRLEAVKRWRIFSDDEYLPVQQTFSPGILNILDLSQLESGPRGLRNLTISIIARNLFRARADARLKEEFGLAPSLPRIWLMLDEAHQFAPADGYALAKPQLIRWAKEGRQPGLSIVVATQQPSALDSEILSQCDVILSHKLTAKQDINALNALSQDYLAGELKGYIRRLNRVGEAVLVDDERETVHILRIRPRKSRHGGGTQVPEEEFKDEFWA